jgi:DNA-directed RNA polymerase beta subunit
LGKCQLAFFSKAHIIINMATDDQKLQVNKWLKNTRLDPVVVGQTIGVDSNHINPQVLLAATKKLIKINKLEVEPDNRDDLKFMTFHGLEDFVNEHIEKDAGKLQQKAKMKMQQKKDLSWLHSGFFSPQIKSIIIGDGKVSQHIEGHNPIDNFDVSHKVTKLGEGGISSVDAVPDESRMVNSTYFGFFDPFRISETKTVGVDHRFAHNVIKGRDTRLYRLVLDKEKKPVWVDHETLLTSKVEIPEY